MPDRERDPHWRDAEYNRWRDASMPVWNNERWWRGNVDVWRDHYVRVSDDDPGILIYVQSPEKGEYHLRTRVKAGRYLTKYFGPESDRPVLNEKQIKNLATWQATGRHSSMALEPDRWEVRFATTPEEIVQIYHGGPRSCMSPPNFELRNNPTRVYGAGDLAVAYLVPKENGLIRTKLDYPARCLVWPDKKVMGRVYPTRDYWEQEGFESPQQSEQVNRLLYTMLRDQEYQSIYDGAVTFRGARLLKLKHESRKNAFVLPYLDNGYGVKMTDDHLIMALGDAHYRGGMTCGFFYTMAPARCGLCGGDMDDDSTLRYHNSYHAEVGAGREERCCDPCYRNHTFFCCGSGARFNSNTVARIDAADGRQFARAWAVAHGWFRSSWDRRWYSAGDAGQVPMWNGSYWTADQYAVHGFTCEVCNLNFPTDMMNREIPGHRISVLAHPDEVEAIVGANAPVEATETV